MPICFPRSLHSQPRRDWRPELGGDRTDGVLDGTGNAGASVVTEADAAADGIGLDLLAAGVEGPGEASI